MVLYILFFLLDCHLIQLLHIHFTLLFYGVTDLWNNSISNIQNRLKETELSILTQIGDSIEKAIKRWEADSKPALIEKMKEELFADIRSQIKLINANSGRGLNKDEVEQLIHSALGVYDSDKTGLADFALEPAGLFRFVFFFRNL